MTSYETLINQETLRRDLGQEEAARLLDDLEMTLREGRKRSLPWQRPRDPQGLYLWGGVGAGKTLLMDLFAAAAPDLPTRRVHYHAFMEEMHGFIADWRDLGESERRKSRFRARRASLDDPIPHAAKKAFLSAELLCLDEMQVTDIADAMLLGRLFEAYFERGGVLVVTSNRPPQDLYKDGINRELFLPFIRLLSETLNVYHLQAGEDYRLSGLQKHGLYFSPIGPETDAQMDRAFETQVHGQVSGETVLTVHGRHITLRCTVAGVVRESFAALCEKPLGAVDYLEIARRFATVFLDRIPLLTPENADAASRFRNLVDALYDHRCKLVCSAADEPDQLYRHGKQSFEFERTASRLYEMRSESYLRQEHRAGEKAP
ncbi:MAG: cell division protein ZapE [Parvularcula sp.]|nr:cell division protein ZapE [Parvularcula sp.]